MLGTERHESRRIDNQLRGRSGRQGDPGESRFYLSLGDDLMRRFNGQMRRVDHEPVPLPDDVPIEAGMVTKAIQSAQTQVEQQNFEIRKNVLKYDEVLNKQRTVIYDERRRVLAGEDMQRADRAHARRRDHRLRRRRDRRRLRRGLGPRQAVDRAGHAVPGRASAGRTSPSDDDGRPHRATSLEEAVLADARAAYARREAEIDASIGTQGGMRELERQVLLQVMDRKWREHLYEMDYLKEGIGLRAMAQRDPLIEYQREGFDMFAAMLEGIKEETVGHLFNVRVQTAQPAPSAVATAQPDGVPADSAAVGAVPQPPAAGSDAPADATAPAAAPAPVSTPPSAPAAAPVRVPARSGRHAAPEPDDTTSVLPAAFRGTRPADLSYTGPAEDGTARTRSANGGSTRGGGRGDAAGTGTAQPSRNRPCPCGSGRKYKQCHGSPTAARP